MKIECCLLNTENENNKRLVTSNWSPMLTTRQLGMGLMLTHLPSCLTWSPPIPFWMRKVKKPISECEGKPRVRCGCGHGGYKFTTKICKPESKPNKSIMEFDSIPRSLIFLESVS